jgi:osmotically-inducible protein OsmY
VKKNIYSALHEIKDLALEDVGITVENGKVRLSGTVETLETASQIKEVIGGIHGVRIIVDDLLVLE